LFLHVQYRDNRHDFVKANHLDKLIELRQIKQFYRPSEGRWVDIAVDPVREVGGNYGGPERRRMHLADIIV